MFKSHTFLFIFIGVFGLLSGIAARFSNEFSFAFQNSLSSSLQANILSIERQANEAKDQLAAENPTSLIFVGDIMLGRDVEKSINKKEEDWNFIFLKSADFLQTADLVFGNLEGSISSHGKNQGSIYSFRFNPLIAPALKSAGFNVISLANNHILDWGGEALADTISILKENNIDSVGAGLNREKANSPVIKKINGTKIAFFAFTNLYPEGLEASQNNPGVSSFDLEKIKEEIKNLKQSGRADIVIISLHWGEEYKKEANDFQKQIARSLVNFGADILIGHHPHVVEEVEKYGNSWIAYSLGNFVFDQNFSKETMEGLALKVSIKNKKVESVETFDVKINNDFQPEIFIPAYQ